jgi:hypothetical protein
MNEVRQITFFDDVPVEELTERQLLARNEHISIRNNAQAARASIIACLTSLKRMRDEKLYKEFGFESFENYTLTAHNIGERQAYNWITVVEKNTPEFLQAHESMELTKLIAISSLPEEVKEKFVAENAVDDMSTREIAAAVKGMKEISEGKQTSLAETMAQDMAESLKRQAEAEEAAALTEEEIERRAKGRAEELLKEADEERISLEEQYKAEISDMKKKQEKIIAAAVKDAVEKAGKESAALKDAANKRAKQAQEEAEKAKKEAESAKAEADKLKADADKVKSYKDQAERAADEKAALEKQIKLSANPELTRFKFLFEAFQESAARLAEQLSKLDDENRAKCKNAIKAIIANWEI